MIILLSKKNLEIATEIVMEWIYSLGFKCIRLNGDEIMTNSFYQEITNLDDILVLNGGIKINLKEVSVVWFRRWSDRQFLSDYIDENNSISNVPYLWLENLAIDQNSIRNFYFSKFSEKPFISNPADFLRINKFIVLNKAKQLGFNVPDTIVCNTKSVLSSFLLGKNKVITKDIENSNLSKIGDSHYCNFTTVIEESMLKNLPETFALSVFQELIEKEYELRIFYFFGEVYTMAIFSQNDAETNIDFRKYNLSKPNRNVPYCLNSGLIERIILLMNHLNLETGSLDIIKSKTGEYIFLEVNPVGQLTMVSKPCNYNLELLIAKKLISYEK